MATVALHALHLWAWALYGGSLVYIYVRLFPDLQRALGSGERFETCSIAVAHGLRWWIFGAVALAGASGVGLAALRHPAHASGVWWAVIALKSGLFVATLVVYAYTSWVMWPRRVFVAAAARPAEQRRFYRVAALLAAMMFAQLVLGVLVCQPR